MEGAIDTTRQEWATKGERVDIVKHKDNLKTEGEFQSRQVEEWHAGERAAVVKHDDNLRMEGQIDTSRNGTQVPRRL